MTEFKNLSEKILGYNPDTQERLLFTRDVREAIRLLKEEFCRCHLVCLTNVKCENCQTIDKIFGPELTHSPHSLKGESEVLLKPVGSELHKDLKEGSNPSADTQTHSFGDMCGVTSERRGNKEGVTPPHNSDEKTCANCGCLRTEHPVYSGDFLECKSYKEGAKD